MSEKQDINEAQAVDCDELKENVPTMNVGGPVDTVESSESNIISDDAILGIYSEILNLIKEDRKEISEHIGNFSNLILNDGDATSASKEALVNLLKAKADLNDKSTKIADLMTRVKLKEKDTFPKYLAASQNNTFNIGGNKKQALLSAIEEAKRKEQKNG